ncbi:MAG: hypothetical protein JWQ57_1421, partial [Mucilaginibacter sp.]|nr:hypothetical protein [Mucilaginibacter sp.]
MSFRRTSLGMCGCGEEKSCTPRINAFMAAKQGVQDFSFAHTSGHPLLNRND